MKPLCVYLKYVLLTAFLVLSNPASVSAGEPPVPSSPEDKTTVSSTKITWQAPSYPLYTTNPYRIQLDDSSDFSSINKDYYTRNIYYTPTLSEGTWFWRVKAKDSNGSWSSWSLTSSFILSTQNPSPTPIVIPSPSINPTPYPTTLSSSFIISSVPSQINFDESFKATINLILPDEIFINNYLKGAFKKIDGSNYFGQTLVSENWVKNSEKYDKQYRITTDAHGQWLGELELQPDAEDPGFNGEGDYIFKAARYNSSGNGPIWSNEVKIKINYHKPKKEPVKIATNIEDSIVPQKLVKTINTTPNPKTSTPPKMKVKNTLSSKIASVAAVSSSSAIESSQSAIQDDLQKQSLITPFTFIGTSLILLGFISLGTIFIKSKGI